MAGGTQFSTSELGTPETKLEREIRKFDNITADCENPLSAFDGKTGVDAHKALSCSVFTTFHTEVASERVFSHSGRMLEPLRESMSAESASLFIFLHENIKFWPSDKAIMRLYWQEHFNGTAPPYELLKQSV